MHASCPFGIDAHDLGIELFFEIELVDVLSIDKNHVFLLDTEVAQVEEVFFVVLLLQHHHFSRPEGIAIKQHIPYFRELIFLFVGEVAIEVILEVIL